MYTVALSRCLNQMKNGTMKDVREVNFFEIEGACVSDSVQHISRKRSFLEHQPRASA